MNCTLLSLQYTCDSNTLLLGDCHVNCTLLSLWYTRDINTLLLDDCHVNCTLLSLCSPGTFRQENIKALKTACIYHLLTSHIHITKTIITKVSVQYVVSYRSQIFTASTQLLQLGVLLQPLAYNLITKIFILIKSPQKVCFVI